MQKSLIILVGVYLNQQANALSGISYVDRFQSYLEWSKQSPIIADNHFLNFIDSNTPLAHKLREQWLYQLARAKDWSNYHKYYQKSNDINLQCFYYSALYEQGNQLPALVAAKRLWLDGHSKPSGCNDLFNKLLTNDDSQQSLITERINLALKESNISLARHLLRQYHQPRLRDIQILNDIHQNPMHIAQLEPSVFSGGMYLYGLHKLVNNQSIGKALALWQHPKTLKILSLEQQQCFLATIALYKAIHDDSDALLWFNQIKPVFYTEPLLDWHIRYALKHQLWHRVVNLINHSHAKSTPAWQYWLARAYEALGQHRRADIIYNKLADQRNYYGFLASMHLHKPLSFENEYILNNTQLLKNYQPIMKTIEMLYANKRLIEASRLLSDFISELPKHEKIAMLSWVATVLHWHSKVIVLSNSIKQLKNQLSLRFPLVYRSSINQNAKIYHIPEGLIYAIIWQESTFRRDVISSAGAHGLMQLMPATARAIAKIANIPYANKEQLFSTSKNISIGTAYLHQLAGRFKSHPVLMAAAYNAGPRQVSYWLKNHSSKPIDIWIETLPWRETRNYIKNVIAFYAVYQYRMQQKNNFNTFMYSF